ncbi:2-amino-4-hydroxy-6-hydroxymethyldihydropteridine diphosphokinase [Mycolicibacter arupensis]|jgi:2-amino-4-hydroxy-6-hydroxymethyldihydropteridine diphosphokinase|uniref:2-amino-4-hydroxy-6-hydroxymethyldihydropteridine diphosphokinase n=1 Tax=Mycolicibacter arupensis TaxID=342002 RepID=A0A0F5MQM0_9MYCO|nr:2-amino-4-hydroxy-6-hydroxymethyldihydropteridine diphosphokinase [Mycolicibacter arupensis]KAA1431632.1 2-amino-4-hydroxy-6-hydroxymethyldihydropteridine diphosphokinase [Mycolicibacter arupensis]KKB97128.1 2-amino-4-hydroxy-6-hydroxymethyldihydropteridine pyrophosphokinase [Mycolicibacter arupensis]MCV7274228.1 2-amino-4-hydroxy-6-hydroxymethyldihydropteridine diphosphokinase [Mycolicibacter arupensis]OQZ92267.1 2-amino-4-hydroxy-6-hydroxymethyldihydropteridine diphosphokinase [Mycolicibac
MTTAVLSIGSNLGDRLALLQSAVDGLGAAVTAVSGVYETEAWGGVEQGPFLNAVLIVEDPGTDGRGWLRRAHELEQAAERVRAQRWGPRTLDVDVISCHHPGGREVRSGDPELTLPHPRAHLRGFVLTPWLAVDPQARLTVGERSCAVADLLDELAPQERAGVALTDLVLQF